MMSLSPLFAQSISEFENSCDYQSLLKFYQSKDSINTIEDPQLLFEMATVASNADAFKSTESYFRRIIANHANNDKMVYYLAKVYLRLGYDDSIIVDSLKTEVENKLGKTHEMLAVIDLLLADEAHRSRKKINLDSTITASIGKIKYLAPYKKIVGLCLQDISKNYADRGKLKEGIIAAKEFENFISKHYRPCSEEISSAYTTRGRRYLDADMLDSAAYYIEKSYLLSKDYHPNNSYAIGKAAINLSEIKKHQGDFQKFLQLLKEAESIVLKDSIVASKLLPTIYNNIGLGYKAIGSYKKAIDYYQKSIMHSERVSPDPSVNKIAAYFNTGAQLLTMDEIDLSEKYRNKALELSLELLGEEHRFTAIILMSLGSIQYEKKNYEACENYYNRSLKIRKKIYGKNHTSLATVYSNYASLYQDQKMFDKAQYYIGLTIDIYKKQYGETDPKIAQALYTQASIEFDFGDYSKSREHLAQAKKILTEKGNYKGSTNSLLYLDIINNSAKLNLTNFKNNKKGNIDDILKDFQHAVEVFDYHIEMNEEIADISQYANDYPELFDNYVEALVLKSQSSNSKEELLKAYQINDKGKNLGLLKSLTRRSHLMFAEVPKNQRDAIKNLKGNIQKIEKQLYDVIIEPSSEYQLLLDSLDNLQSELYTLNDKISKEYPAFDQLKNTGKEMDTKAVIPKKGSHLAIIDFRIMDSILISFSLYNDKLYCHQTKLPHNFSESTSEVLENIFNIKEWKIPEEINNILTQTLKDLPESIDKLVIIPDKYLSSFPFEILKLNDDLLINRFAISYANSMSILENQKKMNPTEQSFNFSGFAPQYQKNIDTTASQMYAQLVRSGQWELPFALEEVNYISELLKGEKYINDLATKSSFFEALKNSKIVHLSMHAEADNENPMNSKFIFDTGKEDEKNLLLYELYNLQANSNLVVLSACETGKGVFHNGDGVRSLGNGFLYAGVPSVVMSLWKVPDESTSIIMIAFYEHLKKGETKSEALRNAKLDYLDNVIAPELAHPYYWAGFIISGNDDPIELKSDWNFKTILLFSILALILLWFFRRGI